MKQAYFKKVKFVGSFLEAPTRLELPQFVFCGRSNVGKSSLINAILNQKIAKVSKTPGKTTTINVFLVDEKFYLVDLPGYGFAKRSKSMVNAWQKPIENYLLNANMLRLIFLLIDTKISIMPSDEIFLNWLKYNNLSTVIVLTKIDKASQSHLSKTKKAIETLNIKYIKTSSTYHKGIDKLAQLIEQACDISFNLSLFS
ncbi:MAG: YihA family ribosome biogenesis GTP-binding protein [Desulfurella sp.]|uniref:ribosome biogenesis GTP-binding protein YihA/YsxC n=1 Tax=Desulfurella sp. TaxID=1962857 RepID=UPI000CB4F49C|nr:ribosome biogenesis GTP-binding protein YihA/YsxC [Desulfurella sp.]PMP87666.1 MAG: YihA family ribosome biogenesis GTP-binding protein [Desulfurella sp.]